MLAKIAFDTEGRVVVSVVDALSGAPDVPAVAVVCTLYSTDDLGDWPAAGEAMDGASIAIPRDGAKRFYRVGVSFAEKQTEAAP